MDDLKISKLHRFRFDFLKIEISISDPNFYFIAYDTLATHARGQTLMVGRFVNGKSVGKIGTHQKIGESDGFMKSG